MTDNKSTEKTNTNDRTIITELNETNAKFNKLFEFKVYHWTKTIFWRKKSKPVSIGFRTNCETRAAIKTLEEQLIRDIVENARNIGLKIKLNQSLLPFNRMPELLMTDSVSVPIIQTFIEKNVYIYEKGEIYISDDLKMFLKDTNINSLPQIYKDYPPLEVMAQNLFIIGNSGCLRFTNCRLQFDGPIMSYGYKLDEGFIPDYKSFITDVDRKIVNEKDLFIFTLIEVANHRFFMIIKGIINSYK